MAPPRRSTRQSKAPERFEPDEIPDDDNDEEATDEMLQQGSDGSGSDSGASDSTGSLADFITSDEEIVYDSDANDPDWEDSSMSNYSFYEEESDID